MKIQSNKHLRVLLLKLSLTCYDVIRKVEPKQTSPCISFLNISVNEKPFSCEVFYGERWALDPPSRRPDLMGTHSGLIRSQAVGLVLLRPCGLISSRQGTVGAHCTRDSSFSQIQDKFLRHDASPLPLNALLKEDSQASGEGDNVGSSPALPLTSKGRNEEGSSLPGCSREPGWLDIQAPAVTRHPYLPHIGRRPTRAGREQSRHCPRWAHTSPTPGLVIKEHSQSALSPVQRGENPGPEETSTSAPVPALETQTFPETPARPGQCCGVSIEGLQEPIFFFF